MNQACQIFNASECLAFINQLKLLCSFVPVLVQHGVEEDFCQGDGQAGDQPDVDHLDVGRPRHRVQHGNEESGEDEEEGHVDGDDAFEMRGLKVEPMSS